MFRCALYTKGRQGNKSQGNVLNNFKRNTMEHKLEKPNCAIKPVWFWAEFYTGGPKETSTSFIISAAF